MRLFRSLPIFAALILGALVSPASGAGDASIDRLLSKLPPPEKLVRQPDPLLNDPLAKKAIAAINARNFPRALGLARQLSQHYPTNAIARGLHGWLALAQQKYGEASSEFRSAIAIEPKYSFAYFNLGIAEFAQNHLAIALQNFQQVVRLEPQAEIAWITSSDCAAKLGRRQESLDYAKRATVVAPRSAIAWLQLARAESALGNKVASQRALARAKGLGATRSTSTPAKR